MEKKLFRNEHDKVVAGVSSGLADYMEVDVTIVKLLFILSTIFLAGGGLLVYIIMWIILPVKNDPVAKFSKFNDYFNQTAQGSTTFNSSNAFNNPQNAGQHTKWNTENVDFSMQQPDFSKFKNKNSTSKTVVGLILLVLGAYFLLRSLDIIPQWFSLFKIYKLWPLAIIAVGVSLIFKNRRKTEWDTFKKDTQEAEKNNAQAPVENATIVVEPAIDNNDKPNI